MILFFARRPCLKLWPASKATEADMRNTYIVCYDICDPKRLRDVFKTMRGWGDHLQLSVFECRLTRADLVTLRAELAEIIDHREDQVLFVDLGPAERAAIASSRRSGSRTWW